MKKNSKKYLIIQAEEDARLASLRYCNKSGKFKIVFDTRQEAEGHPIFHVKHLRVYPCDTEQYPHHFHLTSV